MSQSLADQAAEALREALAETHPGERDRLMDLALRLRRLAAAEARAGRATQTPLDPPAGPSDRADD
ncbi:MAG: hypothetical protein JO127_12035 [Caulobacteraceae bacterium]|nr:hypothetical protein [Caulobacteraceae bacterium]